MTLDDVRRFYAEEIRFAAGLRSEALVEAFASVPRERFLGPGPWQVASVGADVAGVTYWPTPDADPRHVYHNVLLAIDPARQLNNGHPASLASWIEALELRAGDRVLHLGCGVGYYTAVIAELVGPTGRVLAIEVDPDLAARARQNLADRPWVEVATGDGSGADPDSMDAVFVNAGATHPLPVWLDRLRPGGRLLLPLTFAAEGAPAGGGYMLKATRGDSGWTARFTSPVGIYSCQGARDPAFNLKLREGLGRGTFRAVTSLSREPHQIDACCWLHGESFCLRTASPPAA